MKRIRTKKQNNTKPQRGNKEAQSVEFENNSVSFLPADVPAALLGVHLVPVLSF